MAGRPEAPDGVDEEAPVTQRAAARPRGDRREQHRRVRTVQRPGGRRHQAGSWRNRPRHHKPQP
eukprot:2586573-Alexandrium_andersonii.AAC.1